MITTFLKSKQQLICRADIRQDLQTAKFLVCARKCRLSGGTKFKQPMNAVCDVSVNDSVSNSTIVLPDELYETLELRKDELIAIRAPSWPLKRVLCFAKKGGNASVSQIDRDTADFIQVPSFVSRLKDVELLKVQPVNLQTVILSVSPRFYQKAAENGHVLRKALAHPNILLRQGGPIYVEELDIPFTVTLCEPVLQGIVHISETAVTLLQAAVLENGDSQMNGDLEQDLEDLTIDESFLSAEFLNEMDSEEESAAVGKDEDDMKSVTSFASMSNGYAKTSSWHLAKAAPLRKPIPREIMPIQDVPASELVLLTKTQHLARLGVVDGDIVLLRAPSQPEKTHLGRLYACDGLFEKGQDADVLLSPMLLFNALGPLDSPEDLVIEVRLSNRSDQFKKIPVASSITLARVNTALTTRKAYYNVFVKALKTHLQSLSRQIVLKEGDLLAVPIDETEGRWSEEESWDIPRPDTAKWSGIVYFKVTGIALPKNAKLSLGLAGGKYGALFDSKVTQVIQAGIEQSRLPPSINFPLGEYHHLAMSASGSAYDDLLKQLTDYLKAALTRGIIYLDLTLSFILQGARFSGKRTIITQAASAIGLNVVEAHCFDLVGENEVRTEATLKARVEKATECAPCVFLLSGIDALARKQQSVETGQDSRMVSAIQQCVDEIRAAWAVAGWPVILAATTSEIDKLPPALLASFKTQFNLEAPSQNARFHILSRALQDDNLSPDVDLQSIATQTAALVAGDLVSLVEKARVIAEERTSSFCTSASAQDLHSAIISLTQADLLSALNAARSSYSESIGAPKIPNVTWDDVGGLATVKNDILDTIQLPLQHPELFAAGMKQRSGILLYGPPGTGKTLLAKAVATSCSLNFFSIKGPELLNMYIGESEANVRRIFQKAREAKPCCVFFDELDSVAPKRGNQGDSGGVMDRIVSQLLAELDGMSDGKGASDVFVIGATNRPDLLDPALLRPGRFDRMLYLGVSEDHESQQKILEALTRKFQLSQDVDLRKLAEACPFNFTGADFYALCSDAMLKAMARKAEEVEATIQLLNQEPARKAPGGVQLTPQYYLSEMAKPEEVRVQVAQIDFENALRELVPSVSAAEMIHYRTVQQKFASSTMNVAPAEYNSKIDKGKGKAKEGPDK